jgi:hypothetical protein
VGMRRWGSWNQAARDESTKKQPQYFIACIQIKRKLRSLCGGALQLTQVGHLNRTTDMSKG